MTATTKLPSVAQMANRANSGHRRALQAVRDKTTTVGPTAQAGEIRGMATVMQTLRRWECIADGQLTERGQLLLTRLEQRHKPWT